MYLDWEMDREIEELIVQQRGLCERIQVGLNTGHGLGQLEFVSQPHIWQPLQHKILLCISVEKVIR
jgi:hypothetical protein